MSLIRARRPLRRLLSVAGTSRRVCWGHQQRPLSCAADFQAQKTKVMENLYESVRDKSLKGSVDTAIKPLIDMINQVSDLYTTSSCAGRLQILGHEQSSSHHEPSDPGRPRYVFQSHTALHPDVLGRLFTAVDQARRGSPEHCVPAEPFNKLDHRVVDGQLYLPNTQQLTELKLVCQGPVLHIRAPSFDVASKLTQSFQHNGLKNATIRSASAKGFIISLTSTTQLTHFLWHRDWNGWTLRCSSADAAPDAALADGLCRLFTARMHAARASFFEAVTAVIQARSST